MPAHALHPRDWWPVIHRLRMLGHDPIRVKRTDNGWLLIVRFKCGITAPITWREVEILEA